MIETFLPESAIFMFTLIGVALALTMWEFRFGMERRAARSRVHSRVAASPVRRPARGARR